MSSNILDIKDLTPKEYEYIRRLVYAKSGINLGEQKMHLVRSRLGKILRKKQIQSFKEYCELVERDPTGEELSQLLDAISTNTTFLFRENKHFEFLARTLTEWVGNSKWVAGNSPVRLWSAACSSGDEPYSIAMVADDILRKSGGIDFKILATDLSTQMLSRAKLGIFDEERLKNVPKPYLSRYMTKLKQDREGFHQIVEPLRKKVTFSRFNLMSETFPFKHGFHVVFCRNVMIYFDKQTQEVLVNKIARQLRPGGYLMIGHSESLNGVHHPLKYVAPTIYQRT